MKNILSLAILFLFLVSACNKEQEDLANTAENEIEDVNSLETFENKIANGVSLVFFHASWCTVCAEQRPAVETVSKNTTFNNVFFGEVEFEQNNEINQPYGVIGFPTIIFFKDGAEALRLTGKGHSVETLEAEINALL